MRQKLACVVVGAALLGLLGGCSSDDEPDPEAVATFWADLREDALANYPGYTGANKEASLLWKFLDEDDAEYQECAFGSCGVVKVLAPSGCADVYMKVNFLNSSGTVVDWSNDTASSLPADGAAVLQFTATQDDAKKIQIVEASCY